MKRFVSTMHLEKVPIERVWALYTDLNNLMRMTLPRMHLRVVRADKPLREGSRVVFNVGAGLIHLQWETVIREFDPPRRFSDVLVRGPFDRWVHTHDFSEENGGTLVRDIIEVGQPHGLIGHLAGAFFLEHEIHDLFRYRQRMTRRLLGLDATPKKQVEGE